MRSSNLNLRPPSSHLRSRAQSLFLLPPSARPLPLVLPLPERRRRCPSADGKGTRRKSERRWKSHSMVALQAPLRRIQPCVVAELNQAHVVTRKADAQSRQLYL